MVGYPLAKDVTHGIWNWEKLWKDASGLRIRNE
jgi:hypothetical protein